MASNQNYDAHTSRKKIKKTLVFRIIVLVVCSFVIAAVLLTQQEKIYSKKRDVNQLKKKITVLDENYNTYQTELNDSLNLDRVKEAARISGLSFAQADQIRTLDFSKVPEVRVVNNTLPENAILWMPIQTPQITASGQSVTDAQALTEQQEATSRAMLEQEEGMQSTQNTRTNSTDESQSSSGAQSESTNKKSSSTSQQITNNSNNNNNDAPTSEENRINEELLADVPEINDEDSIDLD